MNTLKCKIYIIDDDDCKAIYIFNFDRKLWFKKQINALTLECNAI